MYVSEETMQVISDTLGRLYQMHQDTFDTSDIVTRTSMGFILKRIQDALYNRYLHYSVSNSRGLLITAADNTTITIGEGYLVNANNELVKVNQHNISIDKLFSYDYSATANYGAILYIPSVDTDSSLDIKRTALAADVDPGDLTITLRDATVLTDLVYPIFVEISGEMIPVTSGDINTGIVTVDTTYTITGTYASSTYQAFVYKKLEAEVLFGVPVALAHQSGGSAELFEYYPPVPQNAICLAKVLVANPKTPSAPSNTTAILDIQDIREIGDISDTTIFTESEQQLFNDLINRTSYIGNIISFKDVLIDICRTLSITTFSDELSTTENSFEIYWNNRPTRRKNYYQYSVEFEQLERFEFADSFKDLWYESVSRDLRTTLAAFSGDLLDGYVVYGIVQPTISSAVVEEQLTSATGAITPGVWRYAVTAVTPSGESPISSYETVTIPKTQKYNRVVLSWGAVAGATSYHVYRRDSNMNIINDRRLTSDGEVTGTTFTDTGTSVSETTRRGVIITQRRILDPLGSKLYAHVPILSDAGSLQPILRLDDSINDEYIDDIANLTTRNGIYLSLTLELPDGSEEVQEILIPSGTASGTSFEIGNGTLYSAVTDMVVKLNNSDVTMVGSRIDWSVQDLVMIQNIQ